MFFALLSNFEKFFKIITQKSGWNKKNQITQQTNAWGNSHAWSNNGWTSCNI